MTRESLSRRDILRGVAGAAALFMLQGNNAHAEFDCLFPDTDRYTRILRKIAGNDSRILNDAWHNGGLNQGIGYATLHLGINEQAVFQGDKWRNWMKVNRKDIDYLTTRQQRLVKLTENGVRTISRHIVENQGGMTPAEALESETYVGLVGLASTLDIGRRFMAYGVRPPTAELPVLRIDLLGAVIQVESVNRNHWVDDGYRTTFGFSGWENNPLPWIAENSADFNKKLPPGPNGDPNFVRGGRPGLLLISEERLHQIYRPEVSIDACRME